MSAYSDSDGNQGSRQSSVPPSQTLLMPLFAFQARVSRVLHLGIVCPLEHKTRSKSLRKVRQWDDGSGMLVSETKRLRMGDDRYVTLDMEGLEEETPRRKRKRRRRTVGPLARQESFGKRQKPVDPEDLPKRARWTIIITAGFLLLTCMLLVGITLRMAPIIDQMVHSQNEELMNSLNRQDFNASYLMV